MSPNLAVIRQASGEFCEYIHLGQNGVDLVEQQDAVCMDKRSRWFIRLGWKTVTFAITCISG